MSEKRKRGLPWFGLLLVLSVVFSAPVFSQNLDQKVKDLEKKIAQLEQRIVKLEEMLVLAQKNQAKPIALSPNRWKDKATWRLLKKGMNKSDVERILGPAPKVVANVHYGDIWYYPDAQGGNASFNTESLLTSWNEI